MFRATYRLAVITALSVVAAACTAQPAKDDPRVAELQQELAATKQELAASKGAERGAATAVPPAGQAAGDTEAQAAAKAAQQAASEAASQAAGNREAAERAAQAAEQASRSGAATERALVDQKKALAEQKAATARQAEESAQLRRELEAMKPLEFTLPAGTAIPVRTTAEISTKTVKNGSVFDALLERDIVVDGTTLAKAGARVSGIVVSSDPGGRVKGVASLSVAVRSIVGVGANTLTVKTDSYSVEAGSTKGKDAARTGIATGAGAVIGAIAGGGKGAAIGAGAGAAAGVGVNVATRGAAAVIPTETLIEFTLSAPATVVIRK
jgi:hypothetical protein